MWSCMFITNYKRISFLIIAIFILKLVLISLYDFAMPSEARYAAISMRMVLTNNYLMPYFSPDIPFFGKPPLSFWASALSIEVFGFTRFAARLPHLLALASICAILYVSVKRYYDYRTALTSVVLLVACAISYALSSVMTEALLLLGMTITLLSFWAQIQSKEAKNIYGYLFFFGCVISMLTKGPVGVCFPGASIFVYLLITSRWKEFFTKFPLIMGAIIFFGLSLPWFLMAEMKYPGFLEYFILGENWHRFVTPGWAGDRYGHAHIVYPAEIWEFFLVLTLPTILVLFARPKQIFSTFLQQVKKDQTLVFFSISFAVPMLVLTFMRNMIATYMIYGLVPFIIILSRVVIIRNWDRFSLWLTYITLGAQCLLGLIFLVEPALFTKSSKFDVILLKQIPNFPEIQDDEVYYMRQNKNSFLLYWYTKDKVKILDDQNLDMVLSQGDKKRYIIGWGNAIPGKYRNNFKVVNCIKTEEDTHCLYESNK